MRKLAATVILAGMVGACGVRGYPALQSQRRLLGAGEPLDDRGIAQILQTQPQVPAGPRVALLLLDSHTYGAELDAAARQQLSDELQAKLDRPPIAAVTALPTTIAPFGDADTVPSLAELRSAAARLRADVLVLATVATNDYRTANPLAVTYLAVLPMYVVPGSAVEVYASAEACAIDVRTGIFLGCASGRAESEDSFVTMVALDEAARDAALDAARQALLHIPEAMPAAITSAQRGES